MFRPVSAGARDPEQVVWALSLLCLYCVGRGKVKEMHQKGIGWKGEAKKNLVRETWGSESATRPDLWQEHLDDAILLPDRGELGSGQNGSL